MHDYSKYLNSALRKIELSIELNTFERTALSLYKKG